jgi:single-strand DNA-binding protein
MNFSESRIAGNLTCDPEEIGDKGLVKFGVAYNHKYNDVEEVDYYDVVAFGKTGEAIMKFFNKGDNIFLCGMMRQQKWETKDGDKRTGWTFKAQKFVFTGAKKKEESNY